MHSHMSIRWGLSVCVRCDVCVAVCDYTFSSVYRGVPYRRAGGVYTICVIGANIFTRDYYSCLASRVSTVGEFA